MAWWKDAVIYQIYPRSFQDSNGDGIGDIPGIISRLDHLQELGVDAIWLSPVYRSPGDDRGYDISDYCDIAPEYGTLADMDSLITEAKKRNIRIIMDLVINHTSTKHEWFKKSRERVDPYTDYYHWEDKPNNWTGFFGEDCWVYDEVRGQYYLHLFAKTQADLNWSCPHVLEEVRNILRFWLDRGVAGFRCDVINILYKDSLESSKKNIILTGSEHYLSLDGTHAILRELRKVLDEYNAFTVGETVFVTPKIAHDLTDEDRKELNMIFSFQHMECDQYFLKWFKRGFRPKVFMDCLVKWQKELPWNTIYLENHDQPRSIPRFGSTRYWKESGKLLATMVMTLRGTPFIYEGQEFGMLDFDFEELSQLDDVESHNVDRVLQGMHVPKSLRWKIIRRTSRDNARTPVQWDASPNAGFTTGKPWLGINSNYRDINCASQQADPDSILSFYKELIALRRENDVLRRGDFTPLETGKKIFAYRRTLEGQSCTIVLNFSDRNASCSYRGALVKSNYLRTEFDGTLSPWEAVILN